MSDDDSRFWDVQRIEWPVASFVDGFVVFATGRSARIRHSVGYDDAREYRRVEYDEDDRYWLDIDGNLLAKTKILRDAE